MSNKNREAAERGGCTGLHCHSSCCSVVFVVWVLVISGTIIIDLRNYIVGLVVRSSTTKLTTNRAQHWVLWRVWEHQVGWRITSIKGQMSSLESQQPSSPPTHTEPAWWVMVQPQMQMLWQHATEIGPQSPAAKRQRVLRIFRYPNLILLL